MFTWLGVSPCYARRRVLALTSRKAAATRTPQSCAMPQVVTLTLNPALDISTSVPVVEPASKLRCGPARRDPGGGGINVARVVQRLGGEVLAVYPAGGLSGRMLHDRLDAERLPGACISINADTRESFTVVETSTNREFRFILPGPTLSERELRACLDEVTLAGAAFVVVSGGLPPGAPDDVPARLARQAKAAGAKVVLDCSGPALKAALDEGVWLVKPNLRELEEVTGLSLTTDAERLKAVQALITGGAAEIVALTMGDQGAMLATAQAAWRAEPLPIKPMSSVGAGDSFVAGMVWAAASGSSLEEAFRYGMAAGSAALLSPGTELCHADDARRLLAEVRIRRL